MQDTMSPVVHVVERVEARDRENGQEEAAAGVSAGRVRRRRAPNVRSGRARGSCGSGGRSVCLRQRLGRGGRAKRKVDVQTAPAQPTAQSAVSPFLLQAVACDQGGWSGCQEEHSSAEEEVEDALDGVVLWDSQPVVVHSMAGQHVTVEVDDKEEAGCEQDEACVSVPSTQAADDAVRLALVAAVAQSADKGQPQNARHTQTSRSTTQTGATHRGSRLLREIEDYLCEPTGQQTRSKRRRCREGRQPVARRRSQRHVTTKQKPSGRRKKVVGQRGLTSKRTKKPLKDEGVQTNSPVTSTPESSTAAAAPPHPFNSLPFCIRANVRCTLFHYGRMMEAARGGGALDPCCDVWVRDLFCVVLLQLMQKFQVDVTTEAVVEDEYNIPWEAIAPATGTSCFASPDRKTRTMPLPQLDNGHSVALSCVPFAPRVQQCILQVMAACGPQWVERVLSRLPAHVCGRGSDNENGEQRRDGCGVGAACEELVTAVIDDVLVGRRLRCHWSARGEWYGGVVESVRVEGCAGGAVAAMMEEEEGEGYGDGGVFVSAVLMEQAVSSLLSTVLHALSPSAFVGGSSGAAAAASVGVQRAKDMGNCVSACASGRVKYPNDEANSRACVNCLWSPWQSVAKQSRHCGSAAERER